ncbi:hypothetical protein E1165_25355 [Micromonospora sp. KC723]|nr:hypothetical protein E1165_25355 [Micromonospora sp. KC723]
MTAAAPRPRPKRTRTTRPADPATGPTATEASTPAPARTAGPADASTSAAEPVARTRHLLPDLASAGSWEAFGLNDSSSGPALPFPDTEPDGGVRTPIALRWDAASSDPATVAPTDGRRATARTDPDGPTAVTGPDGSAGEHRPDGSAGNAGPDGSDAGSTSTRSRFRRGLFRRGRAKDGDPVNDGPTEEPMAAQDEEFVDWVAGLGKPLADNEPETQSARRSLRGTGRHHRDLG